MRTLDWSAAGRKPIPPRATLVGTCTVRVLPVGSARYPNPQAVRRRALQVRHLWRKRRRRRAGAVRDRSDHRPRMRPTTPWEAAQALGTSRRLASRGVPAPRRGEPPGPGLTLCLRAVVALWATPLLVVLSSCFVPPTTPDYRSAT